MITRHIARAIGWMFVALVGYHAVRAWRQAAEAVSDDKWGYAVELAAIALIATFVTVAAVAAGIRALIAHRRARRSGPETVSGNEARGPT